MEERDSSRLIKSKEVVTTKKAYMAYNVDRNKLLPTKTVVVLGSVAVTVVVAEDAAREKGEERGSGCWWRGKAKQA